MTHLREQPSYSDGHGAVGRTDASVSIVIHHFAGSLIIVGHQKF